MQDLSTGQRTHPRLTLENWFIYCGMHALGEVTGSLGKGLCGRLLLAGEGVLDDTLSTYSGCRVG